MENKIEKDYPSLCYGCDHARSVAKANEDKGYTACTAIFDKFDMGNPSPADIAYIEVAKEIATGWVYHKRRPLSENDGSLSAGVMTNGQIITKQVTRCSKFAPKN